MKRKGSSRISHTWLTVCLVAVAGFAAEQAMGTTYHLYSGDNIYGLTGSLVAGDTIILHAGTYSRFKIIGRHGAAAAWITIKGAEGEARPLVYYAYTNQNVIEVNDCSYIELKGFDISGGSDGIKINASTGHYITYEDLYIHHVGATGINMSGIYEVSNLIVRNCEISYTGGHGEGMYIGKHLGYNQPQVHHSLIERNFVHNVSGSQADGIELKHGCNNVIIQDNVVNAPTIYAGITTYSTYTGNPADNIIVRRNMIYDTVDCAIYSRGGEIDIENNIIVNALSNGIYSTHQENTGQMKYMRIINNTIYSAGNDALSLRGWDLGPDLVLANNAIYQSSPGAQALNAVDGMSGATIVNNYFYGSTNWHGPGWTFGQSPSSTFVSPSTVVASADLYPKPGSWLIDGGDNSYAPPEDFSFLVRPNGGAADVGAYEVYTASNPGWALDKDFKDTTAVLTGDVNGDGTTNIFDLLQLAAAWDTCSDDDASYDARADLYQDGCVNIMDLLEMAAGWNTSL